MGRTVVRLVARVLVALCVIACVTSGAKAAAAEGTKTIKTVASRNETPPCQLLFMPGTDDLNVGATTPLLGPTSSVRHGSRTLQRFVATATGTYVLAMTNDDIFLSGPLQCLDAPSERPFTFTVKLAHRGSAKSSARKGGPDHNAPAPSGGGASTSVVDSALWLSAVPLVGDTAAKQ